MKSFFKRIVILIFGFSLLAMLGCSGRNYRNLPQILDIIFYEGENPDILPMSQRMFANNTSTSLSFGIIGDEYPSVDIIIDNPEQDRFLNIKLYDSFQPEANYTLSPWQYSKVGVVESTSEYDETSGKFLTTVSVKLEGYPLNENRIIEIRQVSFTRNMVNPFPEGGTECDIITLTLENNLATSSSIVEDSDLCVIVGIQKPTTTGTNLWTPEMGSSTFWRENQFTTYRKLNYSDLSATFGFVDDDNQILSYHVWSSSSDNTEEKSQTAFPYDGFEVPTEYNGFTVQNVFLTGSGNCLFRTLNYENIAVSRGLKIHCTFDSEDTFTVNIWNAVEQISIPTELTAAEIFALLFPVNYEDPTQVPEIVYNFSVDS